MGSRGGALGLSAWLRALRAFLRSAPRRVLVCCLPGAGVPSEHVMTRRERSLCVAIGKVLFVIAQPLLFWRVAGLPLLASSSSRPPDLRSLILGPS